MKNFAAIATLGILALVAADYLTHPNVSVPVTNGFFSFLGNFTKLAAGQTG